ncbi:hypothetical protein FA95DRAFT_55765 [Auriscalpium vulgare]|uniref:Uncharacterized protein n=1 Tax=Auriscalpium vulgare TaxID=40419 RepID=A0ACB8S872_9AGAM|nr:hypothetical protein FA95DRAFT_55765 [Auriscalpium vulgare]
MRMSFVCDVTTVSCSIDLDVLHPIITRPNNSLPAHPDSESSGFGSHMDKTFSSPHLLCHISLISLAFASLRLQEICPGSSFRRVPTLVEDFREPLSHRIVSATQTSPKTSLKPVLQSVTLVAINLRPRMTAPRGAAPAQQSLFRPWRPGLGPGLSLRNSGETSDLSHIFLWVAKVAKVQIC